MPFPRRHLRQIACATLLVFVGLGEFWLRRSSERDSPVLRLPTQSQSSSSSPAAAVPGSVAPPAPTVSASATVGEPQVPPTSIDEWIQSRFPGSRILEQRQTARDAAGKYTREFLLETDFKYPLIEVAEHLERDSATGADVARTREAMVADHLLLKPRPDLSAAALQAAVATAGASVDATLLAESGVVRVQLAKAELGAVKAAIVQIIRTGATAAYAEPDYLFFAEAVPNDPSYDQQSGLHNAAVADADIDAERGWNLRSSAANIRVAVIDTGVRYTHQDLRTNMWHNPGETAANGIDDDHDSWVDDVFGVNFYGNTADPSDDSGHGTHVAGILGASGNDSTGITGVAWQVQIMAVKFQNQNGVGAASDAIRAINYAVAKHAHLINASWGGYSFSQPLSDSIAAARDAGILFIAAAGNNGLSTDTYPQYPS